MATKTKKQPAATEPATKGAKAQQPAAGTTTYGVRDLAEALGSNPKSVRNRIRRLNGGPVVGRGGRYSWTKTEFEAQLAALRKGTEEKAASNA